MRRYSGKVKRWLSTLLSFYRPTALTWVGWEDWREKAKKTHPYKYFIIETVPAIYGKMIGKVTDTITDGRSYIRNRWVSGSHLVLTSLKKGQYHECDTKMLYAMFDLLQQFVDSNKAYHNSYHYDSKNNKKTRGKYGLHWYNRWYKMSELHDWKCPEAGLDHLAWEVSLDNPEVIDNNYGMSTHQAAQAREMLTLYMWWVGVYKERVKNDDAAEIETGEAEFNNQLDEKYGSDWAFGFMRRNSNAVITPAEQLKVDALREKSQQLETAWREEENEMLRRLLKIRRSLWT